MPIYDLSIAKGMDIIMKKFIVVIVFVFLIAILISFNYLLWDREKQLASYQDMSDSNNLTIDALSEKMNSLDKQNKEQETKIKNLIDDNTSLRDSFSMLKDENVELKRQIISKNDLLIAIKKNLDVVPVNNVITKWTEDISAANYINAQSLISKQSQNASINNIVKFEEVFKREIKVIKLKSLKLYTEMTDDEHLNKIQFEVVFEVSKPESTDKSKVNITGELFKSGINQKYLTMELSSETNKWMIQDMKDNP